MTVKVEFHWSGNFSDQFTENPLRDELRNKSFEYNSADKFWTKWMPKDLIDGMIEDFDEILLSQGFYPCGVLEHDNQVTISADDDPEGFREAIDKDD